MPETIDPSTITASVLTDLIKTSFNSVVRGASASASSAWAKIFEDFSPYMEETYKRNRNVRILCQKEKDIDLYEVYVKSLFVSGRDRVSDDDLMEKVFSGTNIIVNGNGGAGKTFFMRHLWLTLFSNSGSRTPIFIELRQVNDLSSMDFKTFCRRTISANRELGDDLFTYFCEAGRFCFLLDGFDEVIQSQRDALQRQILDLSARFPKCTFVVSSRFEKRFVGWQNFELYESRPFDLKQVRQLIQKVPFDDGSKKLFLKRLNISFFRENESFLSNPLLAIMMMMTFRENMEIPKRMNIFYDQAFSTLYQWHDATKAYSREKVLDIDDFRKSFGMFCLLSYYRQVHEFTKTEIVDYISKSNKVCGFTFDVERVLNDYEQSVNLIRQDGLKYIFIHRSFQEYFSALALVNILPDKFSDFLPEIMRRQSDSVLSMCYEMNSLIVVRNYVKPYFEKTIQNGALFSNLKGRFACMARLKVSYEFMLSFDSPPSHVEEFGVVAGLRIDTNPEVSKFIESIFCITDGKTNNYSYYMQESLFDDDILEMFRPLRNGAPRIKSLNLTISFGNSIPSVRLETDRLSKVSSEKLHERVLKELDLCIPIFDRIEARARRNVARVQEWCRSEIANSEQRGKSLDEILGF